MSTIPGYDIIRKLGQGGMAEVYEAVDTSTKQHIALKFLLSSHASDPAARMRFLREAKTGMQLDHPAIVRVLDTGEHKGQPYIIMELVKGKTLDTVMKHKKMPLPRIIDIAQQIADALACAHKVGIVHRDISPKNIMLCGDAVKVMDFGLAKVTDTTTLTGEHAILGTFYYMSPEQAVGDAIDCRSDIFSLGVVLYQLLTGRQPFTGEHAGAIIHALLYSEPAPICDIDHDLPREVEQVVFKALQKKADNRYQSALDLKSDLLQLEHMLKGKSVMLIASDITVEEEVFEKHRGIYASLVGRDRELQQLQGYMTRMLNGTGAAVLVSGEAGIGKSRLVWELGHDANKRGVRYLTGKCVSHAGIPYQPVVEALRQYSTHKSINDIQALNKYLTGHARHLRYRKDIVAALVLRQSSKDLKIINKEQLWDTVAEIIKMIAADRPVVMHLDDLHWADAQTVDMLTYIARTITDTRGLILGTYRPEDITETKHPLRTLLRRKDTRTLFHEIPLQRLDVTGTKDIIASVFDNSLFSENLTKIIHKETEGNPLFVLEVLKLLREENIITRCNGGWRLSGDTIEIHIPKTVTEVIHRRIEKLNRDERELIELAAVDGISFNSDTMIHCLAQPRVNILRGLQNLESSHNLIHATKHGYQFDHGKIKDVIYDSLIPELKKEYHKIIGTYLEEKYGDKDEYAGRIAYHFLPGDDEQKPIPYLIKAGDYSSKLYAAKQALHYLDTAIELINTSIKKSPTGDMEELKMNIYKKKYSINFYLAQYEDAQNDVKASLTLAKRFNRYAAEKVEGLYSLGLISRRYGKFNEGIAYHRKAIAAARKIHDRKGEADNLCQWGCNNWIQGNYKQALVRLQRALKIYRHIHDRTGEARALYNMGLTYLYMPELKKSIRCLRHCLKIGQYAPYKIDMYNTLGQIGWVYAWDGQPKKAEYYFKRGIRGLKKHGDTYHIVWMFLGLARTKLDQGKYAAALEYCRQPLQFGRQTGDKRMVATALELMAVANSNLGEFDVAQSLFKHALSLNKHMKQHRNIAIDQLSLGQIFFYQSKYQKALFILEKALRKFRYIKTNMEQYNTQYQLYELWKTLGNKSKSTATLMQMVHMLEKRYSSYTTVMHQMDIAELAVQKHNYVEARTIMRQALTRAKRLNLIKLIKRGYLLLIQIDMARRSHSTAKRYAEHAMKLAKKSKMKIFQAQAHLLLAEINMKYNDHRQVLRHAQKARDIAKHCGTKELLWKAYHLMGKAYIAKNELSKANDSLKKAQKVIMKIMKHLNETNKKTYSRGKKIKQLGKDLERVNRILNTKSRLRPKNNKTKKGA